MSGFKFGRIFLGAAFILILIVILWNPNREEIRYSRYKCQFDLIYNQSGNIDVAIFGTSRSMQGVSAEIIAKELDTTNKEAVVYNLAKSWRGQGFNYSLVRDLLSERKVSLLLVEGTLPETGIYHANWMYLGTYGDWFKSLRYRLSEGFVWSAVYDTALAMVRRIADQNSQYIVGDLKPARIRAKKEPATTETCRSREEPVKLGIIEKSKSKYNKYYVDKFWSWDMGKSNSLHDTNFHKEIVQLAKQYDTRVVFYHINQGYYKTLDPEFSAVFSDTVKAPLIIPPENLTRSIEDAGGYADTTHMTKSGRQSYTFWLVNALKQVGI